MSKVRIAVVGLGYWGPNHVRVVEEATDAHLAAICDADASRVDRFAARYPGVRATVDLDTVLADPEIDALVIATPAATHHQLALAALQAGKHVLVEKPLARTEAECLELIATAEARSLILMPGHVFLYNAAVRKVRELIQSGELGDVHYAYSQRLNLGQVRRDVNALWNFAPHDLSILDWWLGTPPERVLARGFSYIQPMIEDVVFMTLDYPGGIGANVHLSWLDPHKIRLMTVVGSEKMVVYDDTSPDERIRLYDKGVDRRELSQTGDTRGQFETFAEFQLLLRAGDVLIPKVEFTEPLALQLADFAAAVRGDRAPLSSATSGLSVVRTLVAAQASMESHGSPVTL
jgi:predicted dehydrogenase